MKRGNFFSLLFLLTIVFVFTKIYQHNLIIKLNYEKQRLERKRVILKQEKNQKLVQLYNLKDFNRIKKIAKEKIGLQELKLSQIITLTKNI
jgi:cell division protein FtsL